MRILNDPIVHNNELVFSKLPVESNDHDMYSCSSSTTAPLCVQTENKFLYNTFSVAGDPRTLSNAHLVVANGNEYPDVHYTPSTDMTCVYRDVLKYVHANNEYHQGTLLNVNNFKSLFGFLYFDLTKQ